MGAGGYGAAGLSVRAGMGISELAGVCGKRAERSRVKARAAAKGSMRRFPRKGQKSFQNQNKAPWPREDALPARSTEGQRGALFPAHPECQKGWQQAGTAPPRWKSFARVYVPEFAWHAAPSRLSKVGRGWPSAEVPGEASVPRGGPLGWSPGCESGTRDLIPHPLPLIPRPRNSTPLGSRHCPSSAPSLNPVPASSGFL